MVADPSMPGPGRRVGVERLRLRPDRPGPGPDPHLLVASAGSGTGRDGTYRGVVMGVKGEAGLLQGALTVTGGARVTWALGEAWEAMREGVGSRSNALTAPE
jgi:hypothetical protein